MCFYAVYLKYAKDSEEFALSTFEVDKMVDIIRITFYVLLL